MSEFKQYKRKGLSEMRPYVKGESLTDISVAAVDCPFTDMGMVARNPLNHKDQWYVARKYFDDNLELVKSANSVFPKYQRDFSKNPMTGQPRHLINSKEDWAKEDNRKTLLPTLAKEHVQWSGQKSVDKLQGLWLKKQKKDIVVFGDGDLFKLVSKVSNENEGWTKSTKVMDTGIGCLVQVATQQMNPDGSYAVAEAITFVPGVKLMDNAAGRKVVPI